MWEGVWIVLSPAKVHTVATSLVPLCAWTLHLGTVSGSSSSCLLAGSFDTLLRIKRFSDTPGSEQLPAVGE